MPRSSRHRSHRAHKHSSREAKERSESEDEREARDPKAERGKGSPASAAVELPSVDHGKKRKDRPLELDEAGDRWNGDGRAGAEEKETKGEDVEVFEEEKHGKARPFEAETRGRSGRREEGSGRQELKRRSEKVSQYVDAKDGERGRRSSREERESTHGSGKERDKEYGMEREKERDHPQERSKDYDKKRDKERHSARDRSSDGRHEKSGYPATVGGYEDEYAVKGDVEIVGERPRQDDVYDRDRGTQKEVKKEGKRDEYNEKDRWHGDNRKSDNRRVMPTDDNSKSGAHRDEKYKVRGSREKFYEEIDRDRRSRSDKYRVDRSSREHAADRSDSKYYKDPDKTIDNRNKNKFQDNDYEGTSSVREHSVKHTEYRGKKRSPDEFLDIADIKPRNAKEARSSLDKSMLDNYKPDSNDDRGRPESIHATRVELTPSNDHQKDSPVLTIHAAKEEKRHSLKQEESLQRSTSKDRNHTSSPSSGDPTSVSATAEKILECQSVDSHVKCKEPAHSLDGEADDIAIPMQCERTPRSDGRASTVHSTDRSPLSDRHNLDRKSTRRSLDVDEMGQRSSSSRETREHSIKEERGRDFSQGQLPNSETGRANSLSHNRSEHITRSSPGNLPPPPPVRHGMDSPSALKSGEDDSRNQVLDRKPNSHYKRGGDLNVGRGSGGAWNGVPSWPPPVANGFIPFQHGPPGGFLPVPQQFPPPMFGVRPFMDFNHVGVPLHIAEPPDRFSGHNRPFGWQNPSDDSSNHMSGWDRNSGMFGNDPHMFGRPEWDQNRHLIGDHCWDMGGSPWKGQSGNVNMEKETDQKIRPSDETRTGESLSFNGQNGTETCETKQSIDSTRRSTPDSIQKTKIVESPVKPSKPKDYGSDFCSTYLSKLDISHDLACQNTYNQCINIITKEHEVICNKVNKRAPDQTRSLNYSRKPVFPATTDVVFKKALSLYKKNGGDSTAKKMIMAVAPEDQSSLKTLNVENIEPAHDVVSPDTTSLLNIDSSKPDKEDAKLVEDKDKKTTDADENKVADVEGDLVMDTDSLGADVEVDCSKISMAGVVDAISAGNNGCEGLMTECLSRIPNSPKSTH